MDVPATTPRLAVVVLDTNVVLDWLVFRDAGVADLQRVVGERRLQLATHQPAFDELSRVLSYPQFKLTALQQREVLQRYRSHVVVATLPAGFSLRQLMLPAGFPRCRDHDDEHFLALAYHVRPAALVTKDKEILRLKRRAQQFGVTIVDPAQSSGLLADASWLASSRDASSCNQVR